MKLGAQISLLILLFHFTGMSIASNNNFSNTILINTSISIVDNSWTLVKTENGIKVYFSQYNSIDGALSLKIKFENETNEDVDFSWTLTNKTKSTTLKNISKVEANKSLEIKFEEAPITIYAGETMNDFHININVQ